MKDPCGSPVFRGGMMGCYIYIYIYNIYITFMMLFNLQLDQKKNAR
jgi:hypothetical protein